MKHIHTYQYIITIIIFIIISELILTDHIIRIKRDGMYQELAFALTVMFTDRNHEII